MATIDDAIMIWRYRFTELIQKIDELNEDWAYISIQEVKLLLTSDEKQKLEEYISFDNPDIDSAYDLRREWQANSMLDH